eukprot:6178973-Pleurochrysis_carterae.AAC.2
MLPDTRTTVPMVSDLLKHERLSLFCAAAYLQLYFAPNARREVCMPKSAITTIKLYVSTKYYCLYNSPRGQNIPSSGKTTLISRKVIGFACCEAYAHVKTARNIKTILDLSNVPAASAKVQRTRSLVPLLNQLFPGGQADKCDYWRAKISAVKYLSPSYPSLAGEQLLALRAQNNP